MKVESHPEVLLDRVTQAFVDAVADTIVDAQDMAPRRTGDYAGSIGALSIGMGDPLYGRAKSAIPRAGASHGERDAGQVRLTTPAGGGHLVARIGSSLPQAGAIERGAWVTGRGPHMRAVGNLAQAGTRFVEHMTARLRAAGA
ncbi:MAG: hypothetical protein QOJ81_539 [Chloroflexota bacterium]|nr:hypothetical protein [Chloroflexota bacterium]